MVCPQGIAMPLEHHIATVIFSAPPDTSVAKLDFLQKRGCVPPFVLEPRYLSRALLEYFVVLAMPDEELSAYKERQYLTASSTKRALGQLQLLLLH